MDLAFSADGSSLLSASSTGLLQVWNPKTASLTATVRGEGKSTGISSGKRYAAASWPEEDTVRVVDLKTGRLAQTLRNTPAFSTALSPDGGALAVATGSTTVIDLNTAQAKYPPLERHFGSGSIAWSPDGRYLSTSGIAGADIWSAKTGRHLYTLPDSFWVETTTWSLDSTTLVTAGAEARVTAWDIRPNGSREQLRLSSAETLGGVASIALSPDGTRVIATSLGADVAKVWDISPQGDAEWVNIPTVTEFGDVAFMPDGSRVVAADSRGHVRVWDVTSGDPIGTSIGPLVEEHAFELSPDGRWLTGLNSMATVWNTSTGHAASDVQIPIELGGSNFSADGELLVVNDAETGHGTTVINREGRTIAVLPDKPGYGTASAQFSPDGELVATIGKNRESESLITLWNWDSEEIVRTIDAPSAEGLAFDAEGRRLATAWGTPSVWDVESGHEVDDARR